MKQINYEDLKSANDKLQLLSELYRNNTLNNTDNIGYTLLHRAVQNHDASLIKMILDARADVNAKGTVHYKNSTALDLLITNLFQNQDNLNEIQFGIIKDILLDYGAEHQSLVKFMTKGEIAKFHLRIDDKMIHKNQKKLINEQIINKIANGNLQLEQIYNNYYNFLQSNLNKFILEIKTKSGDMRFKESVIMQGMKLAGVPLLLIPEYGRAVAKGYELILEVGKQIKYKLYMNYMNALANHFVNNNHVDEVVADYAARMVEYYKHEIIESNNDISLKEKIIKCVMESKSCDIANYIFCKLSIITDVSPEQLAERFKKYDQNIIDEHWENLTAKIILNFLDYLKDRHVKYSIDLGIEAANKIIPKWIFKQLTIDHNTTNPTPNSLYNIGIVNQTAYESEDQIKSISKSWGLSCDIWTIGYCRAFIIKDDHKLILAFRGTYHDVNWLNNLNVLTAELKVKNQILKVHKGFHDATALFWQSQEGKTISDIVRDYHTKHQDSKIYITGHSLGGAMASISYLMLFDIFADNIDNVGLYTYAQPRWCRTESAAGAQKLFTSNNYHRVVNYLDLVPQVPPEALGFTHLGTQYYLHKDGRLLSEADYTLVAQQIDKDGYHEIPPLLATTLYFDHHSMSAYLLHLEKHYNAAQNRPCALNNQKMQLSARSYYIGNGYPDRAELFSYQITNKAKSKFEQLQNINEIDALTKLTLLHIAAAEGDVAIVQKILDHSDFNLLNNQDCHGRTAFDLAVNNHHAKIATILLNYGAEVNKERVGEISCWAAKHGYSVAIKLILDRDNLDNAKLKDSKGYTPLYWAAINNYPNIVEIILSKGSFDLETKFDFEGTILWHAAANNNPLVVELLIEHGANVNTVNSYRLNALNLSLSKGYFNVAKLLMFNGAEFKPEQYMNMDNKGNSLLHLCSIHNDLEDLYLFLITEELFVEQIFKKNIEGKNIYDLALENDRCQILEHIWYTQSIPKDKSLYDNEGYHILAKDDKIRELSKIYKSIGWEINIEQARKGIDLRQTDIKGNTILHKIIARPSFTENERIEKMAIIEKLIKYGIDIKYTERVDELNPYELAKRSGQQAIVKLLQSRSNPDKMDILEEFVTVSEDCETKYIYYALSGEIEELSGSLELTLS
ncbi:MAG: hypothetical protein EKK61_03040 [Rickettsiales bacterium]|nr:MAG: hypothetical protein EKK61_03040 [Rickettsiales bacterium]